MTVSLGSSLASDFLKFYLLTCGRHSLVSGTQNEIVVSWITLWGMIKVYWLDLILACIFDHAVCCASAASSGRSLHLITSQLRTKLSWSNCPKYVRRTNIRPVKNGLYVHRNRRLIRDGSPGRPPRLSHSSWALQCGNAEIAVSLQGIYTCNLLVR